MIPCEKKTCCLDALDAELRLSSLQTLKKEDIRWQKRKLAIHGKGGSYAKRGIIPMIERVRRPFEYHFTENNINGMSEFVYHQNITRSSYMNELYTIDFRTLEIT